MRSFICLGNVQNVCLQRRYRLAVDVATDQWRHLQIRILSSIIILAVCKRRQQTMAV